jgi:hypothetical protein
LSDKLDGTEVNSSANERLGSSINRSRSCSADLPPGKSPSRCRQIKQLSSDQIRPMSANEPVSISRLTRASHRPTAGKSNVARAGRKARGQSEEIWRRKTE